MEATTPPYLSTSKKTAIGQLAWAKYSILVITGRNEVVAKVIFLHLSVIHSVHRGGGLPQCMLGYHPPPGADPLDQADPPQDQPDPPRPARPPPDQADPPGKQTPAYGL